MATKSQASLIPGARRWPRGQGRRSGFAWTPLGQILWRHKLFLCCVAVCAVALTSVYVSHVPAVFEAETLVLIGEGDGRSDLPDNLAVPTAQGGRTGAASAMGSPAMALRLVDALSLHLLPEFNPTLRPDTAGLLDWFDPIRLVPNSLFNRLPVLLRHALRGSPAVSDQQRAASLRDEVAAQARAHIVAEPADRPAVIRVRFVSSDPRLAELAANTLAELYLADRLAADQAVSSKARAFLYGEIARLRATIADGVLQSLVAQVAPSDAAGGDALARERALQADRDLLATYSTRLAEIAALVSAREPGVRVISAATTPNRPVNPRGKLILGVALLGALLLGALATLGLERLDATISSVEQLRPLSLALLGTLPTIPRAQDQRRAPDRHILDYPEAPFGKAVAALRDGLVRANVLARRATVLLVSARVDEGTTTTALSLARCHARAGGHPLLIDCDLAEPRLHTLTGATDGEGLAEVLRGERTLDEVLRRDERSGARFVTAGIAGNAGADAGGLLASDAMRSLTREVAADYDMVILDGPPVLAGPDARALAQIADGTVLLARWGHTRREDVIAAAEVLIGAGADMAGLVLTCAKPGKVASQVGANLAQASPASLSLL